MLEVANNTSAHEAAKKGFDATSQLQGLCFDVMYDSEGRKEHPFYQAVKQSFDQQPDIYQEMPTVTNIHYVSLADAFLGYATQLFLDEENIKLDALDDVKLCELYKKITFLVGEESMKKFHLILKQRFFIVPVAAAYMQGLTNHLLYCLTYRDDETSKQIFQLLMDDLSKEKI